MSERKPHNFNQQDTHELAAHLFDQDSEHVTQWMHEHIQNTRDMHALMEFLGRAIYKIFPLGLTKGVVIDEDHYWAMRITGATQDHVDAGRIMTAAFNADWPTMTALIAAVLTHPHDYHAEVVVHLLAALGDGLRAAAAEHDRGNQR